MLQRGDGHFGVEKRRRDDVHDVNQRRLDDFAPVGCGLFPAELCAGGLHAGGVAAADRVQFDVGFEVEEFRRLPPGIGVCPAHEFVADQSDTKGFGHKCRG